MLRRSPQHLARTTPEAFSRYGPVIQFALRETIGRYEGPIYSTHRYYMGWITRSGEQIDSPGGKRLRPTLTLLAAEATGGSVDRALPIATALEYVHNFSLIHDDLEDRDRFRHHRPTVWVVWGDAAAIISGNAMLKIADDAAKQLSRQGVSARLATELQHHLVKAYLTMMEGQFLDLWYENEPYVSVAQYSDMVARKTGALIEAAMRLGAGTANARTEDVQAMSEVGVEVGKVFQVRDDMLGIWGGSSTGKPVGADIKRRKKTLPAIHALNNAKRAAKAKLDSIYRLQPTDDVPVEDVLEIMDETGTHQYCQRICESHWRNAQAKLRHISIPQNYLRDLNEVGTYLLERES